MKLVALRICLTLSLIFQSLLPTYTWATNEAEKSLAYSDHEFQTFQNLMFGQKIYKESPNSSEGQVFKSQINSLRQNLRVESVDLGGFDGILYTPREQPSEKRPAVIHSHGAGADNRLTVDYPHAEMVFLAALQGAIVLAPNYRWGEKQAEKDIITAVEYLHARPDVDTSRIIIRGGSNGSMRNAKTIKHLRGKIAGAHFFGGSYTTAMKDLPAWPQDLPIFISHGMDDSPENAIPLMQLLLTSGYHVSTFLCPRGDHHLYPRDYKTNQFFQTYLREWLRFHCTILRGEKYPPIPMKTQLERLRDNLRDLGNSDYPNLEFADLDNEMLISLVQPTESLPFLKPRDPKTVSPSIGYMKQLSGDKLTEPRALLEDSLGTHYPEGSVLDKVKNTPAMEHLMSLLETEQALWEEKNADGSPKWLFSWHDAPPWIACFYFFTSMFRSALVAQGGTALSYLRFFDTNFLFKDVHDFYEAMKKKNGNSDSGINNQEQYKAVAISTNFFLSGNHMDTGGSSLYYFIKGTTRNYLDLAPLLEPIGLKNSTNRYLELFRQFSSDSAIVGGKNIGDILIFLATPTSLLNQWCHTSLTQGPKKELTIGGKASTLPEPFVRAMADRTLPESVKGTFHAIQGRLVATPEVLGQSQVRFILRNPDRLSKFLGSLRLLITQDLFSIIMARPDLNYFFRDAGLYPFVESGTPSFKASAERFLSEPLEKIKEYFLSITQHQKRALALFLRDKRPEVLQYFIYQNIEFPYTLLNESWVNAIYPSAPPSDAAETTVSLPMGDRRATQPPRLPTPWTCIPWERGDEVVHKKLFSGLSDGAFGFTVRYFLNVDPAQVMALLANLGEDYTIRFVRLQRDPVGVLNQMPASLLSEYLIKCMAGLRFTEQLSLSSEHQDRLVQSSALRPYLKKSHQLVRHHDINWQNGSLHTPPTTENELLDLWMLFALEKGQEPHFAYNVLKNFLDIVTLDFYDLLEKHPLPDAKLLLNRMKGDLLSLELYAHKLYLKKLDPVDSEVFKIIKNGDLHNILWMLENHGESSLFLRYLKETFSNVTKKNLFNQLDPKHMTAKLMGILTGIPFSNEFLDLVFSEAMLTYLSLPPTPENQELRDFIAQKAPHFLNMRSYLACYPYKAGYFIKDTAPLAETFSMYLNLHDLKKGEEASFGSLFSANKNTLRTQEDVEGALSLVTDKNRSLFIRFLDYVSFQSHTTPYGIYTHFNDTKQANGLFFLLLHRDPLLKKVTNTFPSSLRLENGTFKTIFDHYVGFQLTADEQGLLRTRRLIHLDQISSIGTLEETLIDLSTSPQAYDPYPMRTILLRNHSNGMISPLLTKELAPLLTREFLNTHQNCDWVRIVFAMTCLHSELYTLRDDSNNLFLTTFFERDVELLKNEETARFLWRDAYFRVFKNSFAELENQSVFSNPQVFAQAIESLPPAPLLPLLGDKTDYSYSDQIRTLYHYLINRDAHSIRSLYEYDDKKNLEVFGNMLACSPDSQMVFYSIEFFCSNKNPSYYVSVRPKLCQLLARAQLDESMRFTFLHKFFSFLPSDGSSQLDLEGRELSVYIEVIKSLPPSDLACILFSKIQRSFHRYPQSIVERTQILETLLDLSDPGTAYSTPEFESLLICYKNYKKTIKSFSPKKENSSNRFYSGRNGNFSHEFYQTKKAIALRYPCAASFRIYFEKFPNWGNEKYLSIPRFLRDFKSVEPMAIKGLYSYMIYVSGRNYQNLYDEQGPKSPAAALLEYYPITKSLCNAREFEDIINRFKLYSQTPVSEILFEILELKFDLFRQEVISSKDINTPEIVKKTQDIIDFMERLRFPEKISEAALRQYLGLGKILADIMYSIIPKKAPPSSIEAFIPYSNLSKEYSCRIVELATRLESNSLSLEDLPLLFPLNSPDTPPFGFFISEYYRLVPSPIFERGMMKLYEHFDPSQKSHLLIVLPHFLSESTRSDHQRYLQVLLTFLPHYKSLKQKIHYSSLEKLLSAPAYEESLPALAGMLTELLDYQFDLGLFLLLRPITPTQLRRVSDIISYSDSYYTPHMISNLLAERIYEWAQYQKERGRDPNPNPMQPYAQVLVDHMKKLAPSDERDLDLLSLSHMTRHDPSFLSLWERHLYILKLGDRGSRIYTEILNSYMTELATTDEDLSYFRAYTDFVKKTESPKLAVLYWRSLKQHKKHPSYRKIRKEAREVIVSLNYQCPGNHVFREDYLKEYYGSKWLEGIRNSRSIDHIICDGGTNGKYRFWDLVVFESPDFLNYKKSDLYPLRVIKYFLTHSGDEDPVLKAVVDRALRDLPPTAISTYIRKNVESLDFKDITNLMLFLTPDILASYFPEAKSVTKRYTESVDLNVSDKITHQRIIALLLLKDEGTPLETLQDYAKRYKWTLSSNKTKENLPLLCHLTHLPQFIIELVKGHTKAGRKKILEGCSQQFNDPYFTEQFENMGIAPLAVSVQLDTPQVTVTPPVLEPISSPQKVVENLPKKKDAAPLGPTKVEPTKLEPTKVYSFEESTAKNVKTQRAAANALVREGYDKKNPDKFNEALQLYDQIIKYDQENDKSGLSEDRKRRADAFNQKRLLEQKLAVAA